MLHVFTTTNDATTIVVVLITIILPRATSSTSIAVFIARKVMVIASVWTWTATQIDAHIVADGQMT